MVTRWRKACPRRIVLAELWGKVTGSSGGRGGSMHMYAPEYGFHGDQWNRRRSHSSRHRRRPQRKARERSGQVVVSFFGDGAVNSGSFHEAVNIGTVWDLPVVYVCENNLYATEMAFQRATKNTSVASRAAAYGMSGVRSRWPGCSRGP